MRKARWLLFPIALAWIAGAVIFISGRPDCGCGLPQSTTTVAPLTTSAVLPITEAIAPPTPAIAESAALTPPVVSPLPVFVIPFRKNTGAGSQDDGLFAFAQALLPRLQRKVQAQVLITGHTDADGDPSLNERLSRERAEAVKRELILLGVPAERIRTSGAGASRPVADNLTSKGKARNRRVEIELTE